MFWFLHYATKVTLGLALLGLAVLLYLNRHWFEPADAWVETLRRTRADTVPVLGQTTGIVIRLPSGDSVAVRTAHATVETYRINGIVAPPWSRNPLSERARIFRRTRDSLASLVLSNEVHIAYTFHVPGRGGAGSLYRDGTNIALPLLRDGFVIVHQPSLHAVPVLEQVQMLAAEKAARDAARGVWSDPDTLAALRDP